ncbi:cupin domain-containing protein [Saccharopolyspora indica]|uniref:cupin domain-containing protein n=1 Tax=Saccharopolyspora indica TaxID=1229659 RepID=UPI0022EB7AF6|nr:cupin domain-containing protein [Saccharopolyspora indica]MDA3647137.1 cupin domain-containing protein [Saccharopolyspora indica]
MTARAVVVHADEAEVIQAGTTQTLLADSSATGGFTGANLISIPAGGDGAHPHVHEKSAEAFYVLAGTVEILLDDRIETVGKGGFVVVPPGVTHAFAATGDSAAEIFIYITPGVERFEFFRLLQRITRGETPESALEAIQDRYDVHFTTSPVWDAAGHR